MKEGQTPTKTRIIKENALMICVLVVLVIAIIGLVVSLVLRAQLSGEQSGDEGEGQTTQIEEGLSEILLGEVVLGDDEEVNAKIVELQARIDEAQDNETKAGLYWERIDYIWMTLGMDAYEEQVISDAIAADEIRQTANSAFQVVNVAVTYGDEELEEEYNQKAYERLEAEGVDLSAEGVGSDRTEEE